jgi:hypothetical protein
MTDSYSPASKRVLREILRKWDPEGLIEMGLPKNEYDPEVERICAQLEEVNNAEEMAALLKTTLSNMFCREYSQLECRKFGNIIYRRLVGG